MNRIVLPPPAALDHLIHYFHVEAPAAGVTQLPASPFPILTVTLSGAVQVESTEGKWSAAPTAFVGGPFGRPLRYRALPGTVFVAQSFDDDWIIR